MKREFLEGIKIGEESLPREVIDAIWEQHSKALSATRLQSAVELAIAKAGGRNVKAITALLDMESIAQSEDSGAALDKALSKLKAENDYLFTPPAPPYARLAGGMQEGVGEGKETLASALRQRMKQ